MSQILHITGGKSLNGTVKISGAKNAATKMMMASLLTDEPVILHNCPQIGDVKVAAEICRIIGGNVEFEGSTVRLQTNEVKQTTVKDLSIHNRLPVLALSPLLHRAGEAKVPIVGGDKIGPRPVDFHLDALRQMGATITETDDAYEAHAERLHGTTISLSYPSVGATENVILAAVLAEGRTHIFGSAMEPEVVDLILLLQKMGANIEFRADRTIIIDGVERLNGAEYTIMPDRLEAASFALMAIATGGDILVQDARQDDLLTFLNTLRRLGANFNVEPDGIRFRATDKPMKGIEVETDTHPGFATDWQQPLVVLLTQANGLSVIHETVYEDRFGYTETLRQMGASIAIFNECLGELPCRFKGQEQKHSAIVFGPTPLHAVKIVIPDIRAGMAQVLAALIAEGESELTGYDHLERGYENFAGKLEAVGAQFSLSSD